MRRGQHHRLQGLRTCREGKRDRVPAAHLPGAGRAAGLDAAAGARCHEAAAQARVGIAAGEACPFFCAPCHRLLRRTAFALTLRAAARAGPRRAWAGRTWPRATATPLHRPFACHCSLAARPWPCHAAISPGCARPACQRCAAGRPHADRACPQPWYLSPSQIESAHVHHCIEPAARREPSQAAAGRARMPDAAGRAQAVPAICPPSVTALRRHIAGQPPLPPLRR